MIGEVKGAYLKIEIQKIGYFLACFLSVSVTASASVPVRHVLYSTNDLANLGLQPVEGEILYDMVTGSIIARLNGQNIYLPTQSKTSPPHLEVDGAPKQSKSVLQEMRTLLLAQSAIPSPLEGELANDTTNHRVVIFRGGAWDPLGHKAPNILSTVGEITGAQFRHVLPDISTITLQEGELAADFTQNTVWFMANGVQTDLRTPSSRPKSLNFEFSLFEEEIE